MNLFLIGWKLSSELRSAGLAELQRMTKIYPHLDPQTIWSYGTSSGAIFAASILSNGRAVSPRQYVSRNEKQFVLFSGLPIDSTGAFDAHRSAELSSHWNELQEKLDGMFCIVRGVGSRPSRLELLTDIIGMEQVFYYHGGGHWLISNSVHLIARIVGRSSLDPLAISLQSLLGYVGDDRTLLSSIRVIPGGQLWTWKEGSSEPIKKCYFTPSSLVAKHEEKLSSNYFDLLADRLSSNLCHLSRAFSNMRCSLTAGRDSRLVAALLIRAGLKAKYYTYGDQSGTDGRIARQIADALALDYSLIPLSGKEVLQNWDAVYRQMLEQSDGMGSISLIPTILADERMHSGGRFIDLGGTGGEVARGGLLDAPDRKMFLPPLDHAGIRHYMTQKNVNGFGGLIQADGVELGRDYINRFVAEYLDHGFSPLDIPNVFFLYSRVRRKRGNNKRVQMKYQDFYTPFISRAYIKAALGIPALKRFSEPVHYNIIKTIPELCRIPLDRYPWCYQNPQLNLLACYLKDKLQQRVPRRILSLAGIGKAANKKSKSPHYATDMFDEAMWFQTKRSQIREFCLDQRGSSIWNLVNRSIFEKISSPESDVSELSNHGPYQTLFFRFATLFHYDDWIRQSVVEAKSATPAAVAPPRDFGIPIVKK